MGVTTSTSRTNNAIHVCDKTAFILGNGPSLAQLDLRSLSGYATIGLNAAYRHWRVIGWRPCYYACLDLVVGLSHKNAIAELIEEGRIKRFLLRNNLVEALGQLSSSPHVINFDAARQHSLFLTIDPITTGSHASLWAASMGYEQIVLLGVDAHYKEIVEGAVRRDGIELEIKKKETNPNYYFEGYQAPGDRFNLPNPRPDLHLTAWRRAGQLLQIADIDVYNGNDASAVQCFPFVNVDRYLNKGDIPAPAGETLQAFDELETRPHWSVRERRDAFVRAYARKGAIASAVVIFAYLGWIAIDKPPLRWSAAVGVTALLSVSVIATLLYLRFTILTHLHHLTEQLDGLRARLNVLERGLRRRRGD